jgi:hypothetical protein
VSDQDRIAELTAEQARLWEENQRLKAERRAIEEYERRVGYVESSLSWRITKPLRSGKRFAALVRKGVRTLRSSS